MMPMKPMKTLTLKGKKSKSTPADTSSTPMLRLLGAAQKRDVKVTQNLSRIVIFFIICWFPLYTINCIKAFCPDCDVSHIVVNCCIILSHINSVGNPILYAYHLKDFRAALKAFICGFFTPNGFKKPTGLQKKMAASAQNGGRERGECAVTLVLPEAQRIDGELVQEVGEIEDTGGPGSDDQESYVPCLIKEAVTVENNGSR